ncbi:unnamed protein product [Didymodactylos carnosus]|uniref:MULE transposase domain-containing protein n=1 Tax=Didymodactylos carnosus TaxID=1234261 RepID=A0A815DK06_9BILA|nr:unnamed protein product [Didymodactylos carnosus]CAF4107136.1 unnamed protein product [Didymodactylos carnosus]
MGNEIIEFAPNWHPQKIMMDFEKALINTFGSSFPSAELSGCYFHLQQSILRSLQTHGLKQQYETDLTFSDNIHKIPALAFLEPDSVIDGFETLCARLDDTYQDILDYMEGTYIGRIRGAIRRQPLFNIDFWNMRNRVLNNTHKTNNNVEAWHRKMNSAFLCNHPNLLTSKKNMDFKIYGLQKNEYLRSKIPPNKEKLENEHILIPQNDQSTKTWIRYVDDILIILNGCTDDVLVLLNNINSIHPNIKFTVELEKDNKLAFLDVLI